jgi:hypothetical protein
VLCHKKQRRKEERFFILKFSEISIVVHYHTLPANQGMFAWSFDELFQLLAA